MLGHVYTSSPCLPSLLHAGTRVHLLPLPSLTAACWDTCTPPPLAFPHCCMLGHVYTSSPCLPSLMHAGTRVHLLPLPSLTDACWDTCAPPPLAFPHCCMLGHVYTSSPCLPSPDGTVFPSAQFQQALERGGGHVDKLPVKRDGAMSGRLLPPLPRPVLVAPA